MFMDVHMCVCMHACICMYVIWQSFDSHISKVWVFLSKMAVFILHFWPYSLT